MNKLKYLASPYTGNESLNYNATLAVAARLFKEGHCFFSPIIHNHNVAMQFNMPLEFKFWREYDILMLSKCDELWVIKLPGFEHSKGLAAEIFYARQHAMPITYIDP